jgi:hypothetical protein
LNTHSDIHAFFDEELWHERFDDECLQAGQRLRPRVRELVAAWPDADSITLRAEVAGEPCEVSLWPSDGGWDFESTCSCEVRSFCPHAAALLEEAAKPKNLPRLLDGKPVRSSSPGSVPGSAGLQTGSNPPEDTPHLELRPTFHLDIVREETASKVVRLLLQALKIPDLGDWVVARPLAIYGEHRIPLGGIPGPRELRLDTPRGPLVLRRDIAAEMNAIMALQQAGLASLSGHSQYRFLLGLEIKNQQSTINNRQSTGASALWFPNPAHGNLPEFWPWLRATGGPILENQGWTVAFAPEVGHEIIDLGPEGFVYQLEDDGSGWFHLSVGFDVGGKRLDLLPILAQLLERGAMESSLEFPADGHFLHHLEDGRALRLPAARIRRILKQFSALIDPRRFKGSKLKLHPLDAATLAHADPERFTPPDKLVQLIASLTKGSSYLPSAICHPPSLKAQLREYQTTGFH